MSCAACSARIEKAVSQVEGVESCAVNLLTNSMTVEGTAEDKVIISAVRSAGYGASKAGSAAKNDRDTANDDIKKTEKRLIASLVFLAVLMYISMGHMAGLPLPPAFEEDFVLLGAAQLVLSLTVININRIFFINGFKGIIHRSPNMDTLVSLGSGAAFAYSTAVLAEYMITGTTDGHFYFESAAMILTLITVGKMLEARSKGKTTDAIKALMKLSPDTARVERNGKEVIIPVEEIAVNDIFIIRPGDSIPADGIVIDGGGTVNESALTGESLPVDKETGNRVSAGTVNGSGYMKCRAEKTGEDTFLSQIIRTVSDAAASKAPIARIADKVSAVFVPAVMIIALITFVGWMLIGKDTAFAVARGISVLVISCPCALGLATPVAIMVGSGVGAGNGILFKTAAALEEAGKIKTVIFDKTGTLTEGDLKVTDIVSAPGEDEKAFLRLAVSLEIKSEHPVAAAVVNKAALDDVPADTVSDFRALPGCGVAGTLNGDKLVAGKSDYINNIVPIPEELFAACRKLENEGKTVVVFARENSVKGAIALSDTLKEDSADAVKELRSMGIETVMLTGDNSVTANAIAAEAGIETVRSDVLPDEKAEAVREFMKKGKTAMVGDGINDAPALTCADLGIAVGAGTDIAIDSADTVLMNSRLSDVPAVIKLGRAVLKNIKQNLFWAFFYNVIGIPVAAGIFYESFGIELNPMIAAAAMSLSSFCVVSNALRLNGIKLKKTNKKKEIKEMTKTLEIEGMMCMHCEARVRDALQGMKGVEKAEVSHEKGVAVVTLSKDIPFDRLKETVEAQGYKVIG